MGNLPQRLYPTKGALSLAPAHTKTTLNRRQERRHLTPESLDFNNDESLTPEKLREAGIECWTTSEMTEAFQVHGFAAPFVIVTRLSDGVKGSLQFRHHPRVYFSFKPQG